ncbi:MAG: nucleotidyltransferase domain-containing protein [Phycisphaerae bacterium]
MGKKDILAILREFKSQFADQYGILKIGIFGSVVRDESREDSDVDVVVEFKQPDLFTMAGVKIELEDRMHKPVDIVAYRKTMNQFLKKRIDKEAMYV